MKRLNSLWQAAALLCCLFGLTQNAAAQSVTATITPPIYNNTIQYNSSTSSGTYDIYTELNYPNQMLVNNMGLTSTQITYNTNEPGVYFARVNDGSNFGVAVNRPFDIRTTTTEPSDFDSYWQSVVNSLPSVNAVRSNARASQDQGGVTVYDLKMDNILGKDIYCTLSVPTNPTGPLAGILRIRALANTNIGGESSLAARMAIEQNAAVIALAGISESMVGQAPPTPVLSDENEFLDDRDKYYYKVSISACLQAIKYLTSGTHFSYDSSRGIGLFGESQGGGLALMVAGIDKIMNLNRVRCAMVSHPILCDNSAVLYGKAAGFPNYIKSGRTVNPPLDDNLVALASSYYDATLAAKRIEIPVYFQIGYRDFTTHPAGNFAAYNELKGPVHLSHGLITDHIHNQNGFFSGQADKMFFGRYLNDDAYPSTASTLYFVEATSSTTNVSSGGSLPVNGSIYKNDALQNAGSTAAQWSCVDCPSGVTFDNANSYNTTAFFPAQNGIYKLRFGIVSSTGSAPDKLMVPSSISPDEYHTAADYIIVTVGTGGGSCANNGGDADNDGVCANQDCNDNNSSIGAMQTPGTSCNDNDSNTTNDVIQSDGCTCQGTPTGGGISCDNVTVTTGAGSITISNLPADIEIVKVFNASWQTVWECSGVCDDPSIVSNLPAGVYNVNYRFYTANYGSEICAENEYVTVGGSNPCANNGGDADNDGVCANQDCNDNNSSIGAMQPVGTSCDDNDSNTNNDVIQSDGCTCQGTPTGGGGSCDNVTVTPGAGSIAITNLTAPIEIVKVFDATWQIVWTCSVTCSDTEIATGLPAGTYNVDYKFYTATWSPICEDNEYVTIGGGGGSCANNGGDGDGDGVCNDVDCNDNDSNVGAMQPAGTSCDDNDSNTTNDVIQSDGCTCQGTPTGGGNCTTMTNDCNDALIQICGNVIKVTPTDNSNYQIAIHDVGWSPIYTLCADWDLDPSDHCTATPHEYTDNSGYSSGYRIKFEYDGSGDCMTSLFGASGARLIPTANTSISIILHPNPTQDILNIQLVGGLEVQNISLFSITGIKLLEKGEELTSLDMKELPSGIYLLRFRTSEGWMTKKVVKE